MQVCLAPEHRKQMENFGEAAFPNECCGFLFGVQTEDGWQVKQVRAAKNASAKPRTGFLFDGRDQVAAMKEADALNLDIIGYYHSHPNGRRGPSPTDFILWGGDSKFLAADELSKLPDELQNSDEPRLPDHALQFIIAVERGEAVDLSAWQLRRDLSGFDQISLEFSI